MRINTLRVIRKIVQLLFLGLFIYLFVATVRDNPTIRSCRILLILSSYREGFV